MNYINVLTDYIPDLSSVGSEAGLSTKNFIYNAPSLYRVFSFNQKDPLNNFDIQIYMMDIYNNIYPLTLLKGITCNLKFMFIKKNLLKL